jgi:hypothetical protein
MLDDEESDNFADFDDDEEALGVTDEQRAMLASFVTVRRDQGGYDTV